MSTRTTLYGAVLPLVSGGRVMEFGDVIGYGTPEKPDFWLGPLTTGEPNREIHIAFTAANRAAVRALFDAAVVCGTVIGHETP